MEIWFVVGGLLALAVGLAVFIDLRRRRQPVDPDSIREGHKALDDYERHVDRASEYRASQGGASLPKH